MLTAVGLVLIVGAVLLLWRAMVLLKQARKELSDVRTQSETTLALNMQSLDATTLMYSDIKTTVAALDEREVRIVEQVATMRVELDALAKRVEPLAKLVR